MFDCLYFQFSHLFFIYLKPSNTETITSSFSFMVSDHSYKILCFCLPEADLFPQKYLPMQDFTSYLQECLRQNHVLGKLSRCNSHIQVQLQSEFFWEETKSNSWDNLNLYLLRKVTAFWIVSLLQWWFSSSSTTYITWGALHSQWRFLGANRHPEAKMSGWRLWICTLRKKKSLLGVCGSQTISHLNVVKENWHAI